MNADRVVMEYFPSPLSRRESDEFVDRVERHFDEHDFGLWAVDVVDVAGDEGAIMAAGDHPFVGFVGLWPATFEAPFTPAVEVGWRIARAHWGRGYAPEAARAAVADGFGRLGLDEIVSFTAAINRRSRRVMEKIGMRRSAGEDFDHPRVAVGDPLRRHVLYRIRADD